jgi:hypothetical protein
MFGHRYFGRRYWGPRYFGPSVALALLTSSDALTPMLGDTALTPLVVVATTDVLAPWLGGTGASLSITAARTDALLARLAEARSISVTALRTDAVVVAPVDAVHMSGIIVPAYASDTLAAWLQEILQLSVPAPKDRTLIIGREARTIVIPPETDEHIAPTPT